MFPGCIERWVLPTVTHKLWGRWRRENQKFKTHPWLYNKFEATLDCMRPDLKKEKQKPRNKGQTSMYLDFQLDLFFDFLASSQTSVCSDLRALVTFLIF